MLRDDKYGVIVCHHAKRLNRLLVILAKTINRKSMFYEGIHEHGKFIHYSQ